MSYDEWRCNPDEIDEELSEMKRLMTEMRRDVMDRLTDLEIASIFEDFTDFQLFYKNQK